MRTRDEDEDERWPANIPEDCLTPREIAAYPWWYRIIFVIHPDGDLELELGYVIAIPFLLWGCGVTTMLASGRWKPGTVIAVAVLSFIAGTLGIVYLAAIPKDKARIAARSRVPGDLASGVASVLGDTPADRETLVDRSPD